MSANFVIILSSSWLQPYHDFQNDCIEREKIKLLEKVSSLFWGLNFVLESRG